MAFWTYFRRFQLPASRACCAVAILAVSVISGPLVVGQNDPILEEIKQVLRDLGNSEEIALTAGYRESRAHWANYKREIVAGVREQDAVTGADGIEQLAGLYRSRADSRASVVDHYLYGRILGIRGQLPSAYQSFRKALQLDRYFFWAWDAIGVYYLRQSENGEAVDSFKRALQINPRYLKAAMGLVEALSGSGNHTAATVKLQELLLWEQVKEDPGARTRVRLLLADSHRKLGDHPSTIAVLTKVIEDGESDLLLFAMRAYSYKKLERYSEAARDYETILKGKNAEYRYHFELAICYRKMGRNADAAAHLEDGLRKGRAGLGEEQVVSLQAEIESLKSRRAIENPEDKKLTLEDWINRLLHSTEVRKRREAILHLAKAPFFIAENEQATRSINKAFLEALRDKDSIVLAKAIEQIALRWSWNEESIKLPILFKNHGDKRVRGMVFYMLALYGKKAVPVLMDGVKDMDPYVFWCAHEALNRVTLAWVERVLPEEMTTEDYSRVRKKWQDWYRTNRDRYRRYEEESR